MRYYIGLLCVFIVAMVVAILIYTLVPAESPGRGYGRISTAPERICR